MYRGRVWFGGLGELVLMGSCPDGEAWVCWCPFFFLPVPPARCLLTFDDEFEKEFIKARIFLENWEFSALFNPSL